MIDERIQQYFHEELSATEKLRILREIEADNSLKEEFIKYQNLHALINLSPEAGSRAEGEKGYRRFISRLNKGLFIKKTLRIAKYAAAIALLILSTYWVSTRYLSTTEPLVAENNTLYVPAGQRARVTLQDGTDVWLNAQSTMVYPSHFTGNERRVSISGEAYFDVAKDAHKPFIVSTSGVELKVLGTKFNVYCYPQSEVMQTSLIEGSVQVSKTGQPNSSLILKPNQQVTIKGNEMLVSTIKYPDLFLWKEGIYSFNDERLEDIMKKLELYYDVKILIKNEALKDIRYTCKFRQRDGINDIMEIICRIHRFRVFNDKEKNTITIS